MANEESIGGFDFGTQKNHQGAGDGSAHASTGKPLHTGSYGGEVTARQIPVAGTGTQQQETAAAVPSEPLSPSIVDQIIADRRGELGKSELHPAGSKGRKGPEDEPGKGGFGRG